MTDSPSDPAGKPLSGAPEAPADAAATADAATGPAGDSDGAASPADALPPSPPGEAPPGSAASGAPPAAVPGADEPAVKDRSPIAVAIAYVTGLTVVLVAYLAFNTTTIRAADNSRSYAASAMQIARGTGQVERDTLIARVPDGDALIVSVLTDFRARDLGSVAWDVSGLPPNADVRLLFSSDYRRRVFNRPLVVEDGRALPISLAGDRDWLGRITGLAIAVRAPGATVQIRGVSARPQSAGQVLADRVKEWFAFDGWTGTSINTVTGGASSQSMPLPIPVALAALFAIAALALARRVAPRSVAQGLPTLAAVLFVAAWALLDVRWTANLARQVAATWERYQGLGTDERLRAAEDGDLAAFVAKAKAAMPAEPSRVLVLAQAHYFRGRAGWHLLPHRAYWEPVSDVAPASGVLRAGDFVFVWQRPGLAYDPATGRLRFDNGVELDATLVAGERGAALFAIR